MWRGPGHSRQHLISAQDRRRFIFCAIRKGLIAKAVCAMLPAAA